MTGKFEEIEIVLEYIKKQDFMYMLNLIHRKAGFSVNSALSLSFPDPDDPDDDEFEKGVLCQWGGKAIIVSYQTFYQHLKQAANEYSLSNPDMSGNITDMILKIRDIFQADDSAIYADELLQIVDTSDWL